MAQLKTVLTEDDAQRQIPFIIHFCAWFRFQHLEIKIVKGLFLDEFSFDRCLALRVLRVREQISIFESFWAELCTAFDS